MRGIHARLAAAIALAIAAFSTPVLADDHEPRWSFAIHGGAGTIARENMSAEAEAEYRASLQRALDAGSKILAEGGNAMDAIEAAILLLEDDPRFNAGRGAVYTWEGGHELDASIMDGRNRDAGAVAGVTNIRNPILLARKVMTDSPHVMLAGQGAETFASEQGLELVPGEYFDTDSRREALERMKARQLSAIDVDIKFGTVGAVALDTNGNMAAGTSTGGMTGKRWGRIGDAPIIGAGTYADNRSCAVSATGWGEYFIRVGVAHEICTRLRMAQKVEDEDVAVAMEAVARAEERDVIYISGRLPEDEVQWAADSVMAEVKALGGDGGVIVVTPDGHALYSFNTAGMYRGRATSEGVNEVAIYGDE
ncbi:isoaspartyl peptidase/L-asparaginase family protein [Qipengyuania aquimaris]|uniref:isoaspartyl peptidase/L-asparaginase family protein n=1 Tax=Qipengyuania aquimaris TaxID=255984 RepID=UPI001FCFBD22|nr:isoaspartyl peptidase/L-asparaginase [Qipengyuania aquimaris]UOR16471.1 isoaspartyl peptidase/L-asparaginase [Qipengyuania aquimaris]